MGYFEVIAAFSRLEEALRAADAEIDAANYVSAIMLAVQANQEQFARTSFVTVSTPGGKIVLLMSKHGQVTVNAIYWSSLTPTEQQSHVDDLTRRKLWHGDVVDYGGESSSPGSWRKDRR